MKDRIQHLAARIDALALRERALLLLAIVVATFLVWDRVLLEPLNEQAKQYSTRIDQQNREIEQLRDEQKAIVERANVDPDEKNREIAEALKAEIATLNQKLRHMTIDLIDPRRMAKVLEEVLTRETDLRLVGVKALRPEPVLAAQAGDSDTAVTPGVYRHGFVIDFEGSYLSTLEYLKAVEGLPWRFYWGGVEFKVKEYPAARVSITVHTLSLNDAWIGI